MSPALGVFWRRRRRIIDWCVWFRLRFRSGLDLLEKDADLY
ncbi:unnamed protein product [Arabidopsis halleri]